MRQARGGLTKTKDGRLDSETSSSSGLQGHHITSQIWWLAVRLSGEASLPQATLKKFQCFFFFPFLLATQPTVGSLRHRLSARLRRRWSSWCSHNIGIFGLSDKMEYVFDPLIHGQDACCGHPGTRYPSEPRTVELPGSIASISSLDKCFHQHDYTRRNSPVAPCGSTRQSTAEHCSTHGAVLTHIQGSECARVRIPL